ncbi:MAG: NAD-dependent epimerase/dehydratase family protein [Pelobacteraceae bacterium]
MNVLITGATGFVGRFLGTRLQRLGHNVYGTLLASESPQLMVDGVKPVVVELLGETACYDHALDNIDTLIHLAARVHIMHESAQNPLHEFRNTNTIGTANLARQAAAKGVKRFVFMSTIGVNGDNSGAKPYRESDIPQPHNPYSISKHEAELALRKISAETGMELVIIRAPLVYGPGNSGNFLSLLQIVSKGIPLPFAAVANSRSLIYVGNLVDAIATCAVHPAAAGKTYLVNDGEDVSTPDLIRRTAKALDVPARLFSIPSSFMRFAGQLTGKTAAVNRLLGSVTLDSTLIGKELDWKPPFTMEQGLQETGAWFLLINNSKK